MTTRRDIHHGQATGLSASPTVILDTREPTPHPWPRHWPADVVTVRAALETGDLALAGQETGAVIERKSPEDLISCMTTGRDRFERELRRAAGTLDRFAVIVEGTMADLEREARGLHPAAIVGTVAAWTRRGWPIVFAGSERLAALFALRFLLGPVKEAEKLCRSVRAASTTPDPVRL